ncbi:hypothetical protein J6590_002193 [Homalodisca vitripennis]|nr:hypothetical protein J6590_002193 [Homalodisca vitripennis]
MSCERQHDVSSVTVYHKPGPPRVATPTAILGTIAPADRVNTPSGAERVKSIMMRLMCPVAVWDDLTFLLFIPGRRTALDLGPCWDNIWATPLTSDTDTDLTPGTLSPCPSENIRQQYSTLTLLLTTYHDFSIQTVLSATR